MSAELAISELATRLGLCDGRSGDAWIMTFHACCARILRRDIEKIGYERSFTIFDDDDQNAVLKEIYKRNNIDDKNFPIKSMRAVISDAKNELKGPADWFESSDQDEKAQKVYDIYLEYETRLKSLNALDFDDLLVEHPPVLEYYRQRFRYVLVDEYQDTNKAQYQLVHLLTLNNHNICANTFTIKARNNFNRVAYNKFSVTNIIFTRIFLSVVNRRRYNLNAVNLPRRFRQK